MALRHRRGAPGFPGSGLGQPFSRRPVKSARRRLVLLPLALVNRLFEVQLPSCVAKAIEQDAAVARLAASIQRRHYAGELTAVRRLIYCESMRIGMRESLFERLCLLAAFLFRQIKPNTNDRELWLLRPFRLIRIYGPATILKFARELMGPAEDAGRSSS